MKDYLVTNFAEYMDVIMNGKKITDCAVVEKGITHKASIYKYNGGIYSVALRHNETFNSEAAYCCRLS